MTNRSTTVLSIALMTASLTGCASDHAANGAAASIPSGRPPLSGTPVANDLQTLAGHWQGTLSEGSTWYKPGLALLDLTIAPDGTWTGTIGADQASGAARRRGRRLLLTGTVRRENGHEEPVYLDLTGDDTRRWGQTLASFAGRSAPASVSLRKVP